MDIKSVRRVASEIKATLFKNSNSYSIGMLRSHFRGSGLQFKEHQVYMPGDDFRFIDWKMLAKTNTAYIKTFEEERNVEIAVVLDASKSMFAGHLGRSKLQAAIELTCLLHILAAETGDKVHVLLVSDKVIDLPPTSGETGIVSLISALEKAKILTSEGKIDLEYRPEADIDERSKFVSVMKHLRKNREVVIFSDFNELLDLNLLKKVVYNRNVHCFRLLAPIDGEGSLPFSVWAARNQDMKTGTLARAHSQRKKDLDKAFGNKVKELKVDGRYLDDFVKEMM